MDAWIVLDAYDVTSSSSSSSPMITNESYCPSGKEVSSSAQYQDQPTSTSDKAEEKPMKFESANLKNRESEDENRGGSGSVFQIFRAFAPDSVQVSQSNDGGESYLKKKLMNFHKTYPDELSSNLLKKNVIDSESFDQNRFHRNDDRTEKERFDIDAEIFLRPQNMNVLSSGIEWVSYVVLMYQNRFFLLFFFF